MTELDVGPIDYLALEFPTATLNGEGLACLVDLVDRGIIRILDLRFVKREDDGSFTGVAIGDMDGDGESTWRSSRVSSPAAGRRRRTPGGRAIEPGSAVGLLLYENTWAGPFVSAMRRAGADVIASGRIPADDVLQALDALESAPA